MNEAGVRKQQCIRTEERRRGCERIDNHNHNDYHTNNNTNHNDANDNNNNNRLTEGFLFFIHLFCFLSFSCLFESSFQNLF